MKLFGRDQQRTGNGRGLMATGLVLLTAAFLLTAHNSAEERRAKEASSSALLQLSDREEAWEQSRARREDERPGEQEVPDYILNPDMEMPVKTVDGNDYVGVLEIPTLEISLPVMSQWSEERLKISPCRYAGTAYQEGFVIAGHNYRSHFTPLKNLDPGDAVFFTDVDGNVFEYMVAETEKLRPEETAEMLSGDWDLSLFTCTYGGQMRLTVRCIRRAEKDV